MRGKELDMISGDVDDKQKAVAQVTRRFCRATYMANQVKSLKLWLRLSFLTFNLPGGLSRH